MNDHTDALARAVGARIKRQRDAKGLSQYRLAKFLECDPSLVSRFETGKRLPTLPMLIELALALDCRMVELLPENV